MKTIFINVVAIILVIMGFFSTGNSHTDSQIGWLAMVALMVLAVEVYMLPFMIGLKRNVNSLWVLLFVNLLLGWTGGMWVVALIWAVCGKTFNEDELARIQLTNARAGCNQ